MRARSSEDLEELRKREHALDKLRKKLDKANSRSAKQQEQIEELQSEVAGTVPQSRADQLLSELEIAKESLKSMTESLRLAETNSLAMKANETRAFLQLEETKARLASAVESRDRLVGERTTSRSKLSR
eukprot:TRINITY_DN5762_c0_g1_i1.p3 TRINITY_DN5762_c0_g1~~TRINITY_DN5762_c0_g1_i1.p3  ORF type:complete len:129 (-),score=24.42 TRINITY_DN5762_c0_g1_i1:487-873(-)